MRLAPGWLAGQPGGEWTFDGDESIRRRPVDRVAMPLREMGAWIDAHDGRFAPFTVHGMPLRGIEYTLPVASAQVKSCVLIAGLLASGTTTVIEPEPSRDHTERLLARAGVPDHPRRRPDRARPSTTSSSWATSTCPATRPPPPSTSPPRCSSRARGS